jgi:hypothetical protein
MVALMPVLVAFAVPTVANAGPDAGVATGAEPKITTPGPEGDYLRAMHSVIHFRWATKFIEWVAAKRPATDKLNDMSLATEIIFNIRWDGSPGQVTVSIPSGVPEFDEAAVAAIKGDRAFPIPPVDVYGDDGVAHLRWVFFRDARLCHFGEVRRFEAPLKDALPRLFVQGRIKEALLRVGRYTRKGDTQAMSEFARAYLARPFTDPAVEARAAAAVVNPGVPRTVDRLKPFLARPETMALAASAFAAAGVDVCALVQPNLKGTGDAAVTAARTLRAAGKELPAESPCVAALTAEVKNTMAPAAVRAEMLDTLATVNPNGVRKLALDALGESDAKLRAAGVRAFARPKTGKPTLYRLQPLVNDASVDVRAAVAAGMLRSCGDVANDYVTPFLKGKDVQPLIAMAAELAKASSPASAELLAKIQKRPEKELRLPVLAALAARHDAAARAIYQPLADQTKSDPYAHPEARRIVYASADATELASLSKDPVLGIFAYKAMLRAKRHNDAIDWLMVSFDRLAPETVVDAFAAWLANPPAKTAVPR